MEAPECPICLQIYDGEAVVPRVLACGHSACEQCLSQLPRPFSLASVLRCPACTQIVHFPDPLGATALPKNIDLLRLSLQILDDKLPSEGKPSTSRTPPKQHTAPRSRFFASPVWSDEIYAAWKDWILPQGSVLIQRGKEQVRFCDIENGKVISSGSDCLSSNSVSPLIRRVRGDQDVNLLKIGSFDLNGSASVLEYSYVAKIMCVLSKMSETQRRELDSILMMSLASNVRICNIYGLWLEETSGVLYLVSERKNGSLLEMDDKLTSMEVQKGLEDRVLTSIDDRVSGLASICLELCETLLDLQSKGFICGCFGMSCLHLDELRHVYVDLSEVVVMGKKLRKCICTAVKCTKKIDDSQIDEIIGTISKMDAFVSPELLFELLRNKGALGGSNDLKYTTHASSDVWLFSCVTIRLIAGKQVAEDMLKCLYAFFQRRDEQPGYECTTPFLNWVEGANNILEAFTGAKVMPLKQILVKCLDFNPLERPNMNDVWSLIKELTVTSCLDEKRSLRKSVRNKSIDYCLALDELWSISDEYKSELSMDQLEDASSEALVVMQDQDSTESLTVQKVANFDLQQHRDCVTGLTAGGGFLFSCSLDKTIHVWSMQDYSHVHTFRGPEHRVMAVTFVNENELICISGDIGGGIFIWEVNSSFSQEPLKKWYELKDWRYNGIYALAAPANGCLYTGGGDRLIKAWSLLDYTLLCTMEGHKSVVSSLAVCNSVMYSGSWDSTVRLWNLHDHSSLAVLGEDVPGAVASIHSIYVDNRTIVVSHENGYVKVWQDDQFKKSIKIHDGAIFAVGIEGKLMFTGGWDKTVKIQEISGDDGQLELREVGAIVCDSVITSLLCGRSELFIGCSSGLIKVYCYDQQLML